MSWIRKRMKEIYCGIDKITEDELRYLSKNTDDIMIPASEGEQFRDILSELDKNRAALEEKLNVKTGDGQVKAFNTEVREK